MTLRESEQRIVPKQLELFDVIIDEEPSPKPGNAGPGKALSPPRDSVDSPTIRSDGEASTLKPSVFDRLGYIHERARFGLSLAEEKSKLLRFGRFAERDCREMNEGKPSVFDFLGFTHYCGHSRAGKFKLKRKTSKKKLRQKLQGMKDWLRSNLTTPIDEVWQTLNRKLQGYYQYYGVNDNWEYLLSYRDKVIALVSRWVGRRSQRSMSKTDFYEQYLQQHPVVRPKRLTNLFA